jgi:hypothetical protein
MNRDASVDTVIRLRTGQLRNSSSIPSSIKRIFYFLKRRGRLGSPPPLSINAGVKRPWSEADHSSASSTEVKNKWNGNSSPPYAFIASTKTTFFTIFFTNQAHAWAVAGLISCSG